MLAYLVLAGRNGRAVSPETVLRFKREVPAGVPFVPEDHIVRANPDGSVVFFGWQAFTELAGMRSHWAIDDRGLIAFAGHCWPSKSGWDHHSGQSWATQLRAFLEGRPILDAREELYGQYTLLSLPENGTGLVTPDFASIDPIFLATGDECTAISNRAGLCAQAVTPDGVTPERSLTGAGWVICHTEPFFDGETGYWDAERTPLGAHVAITPGRGAEVVSCERCPLGPMGETATYEEVLSGVEEDLRRSIRAIAALPMEDRQLGLSGGIDSRLLTAVILSEGLEEKFRFVTFGSPERPDAIVARDITRKYGLNWTLVDHSQRSIVEERAEILTHTSLAEGLMNGWNSVGALTFSGGVRLTGLAGEYLRWGKTSRAGLSVTNEAELVALMRRAIKFDLLGVMRPEVLEYYHRTVALWVHEQLERGETLQQVPTYFNQTGQSRHRFAVVHAWGERMTLTPFFTPPIVRANQKLPLSQRPNVGFQVDLMRRYLPDLTRMPFAEQGWSAEAVAHLPDSDDYVLIPPVLAVSPEGRTWRVQRYQDYRPMLEEYLLDRSNPIHELIDSDRLEQIIPTGDRHPGRTRRLWALLTAAIWMGRHEAPVRIRRA